MDKNLNKEKLLLPFIAGGIKRIIRKRKRCIEEAARLKRTIDIVGPRLGRWIAEGKYRKEYGSMDNILDELGVTADELSLFCTTKLRMPFLSWRKALRMEDAKRMLIEQPDASTVKIANELGIKDKSNFRHQFKSVTGLSPSEWREKFLKKK